MELIEELFDGEDLTIEEIHKRIEMLEELADDYEEIYEPEEDIEEVRSFVAGNETLH
jgi:tetrahydromethanopterin S-methyltransferase subunit B